MNWIKSIIIIENCTNEWTPLSIYWYLFLWAFWKWRIILLHASLRIFWNSLKRIFGKYKNIYYCRYCTHRPPETLWPTPVPFYRRRRNRFSSSFLGAFDDTIDFCRNNNQTKITATSVSAPLPPADHPAGILWTYGDIRINYTGTIAHCCCCCHANSEFYDNMMNTTELYR